MRLAALDEPDLLAAVVRLEIDAYPIMRIDSADAAARFTERLRSSLADPGVRLAVAECDGAIAGAMLLYDFTMNVRAPRRPRRGLGSVAVSLAAQAPGRRARDGALVS